jgi:hypothetical protein
MPLHTWRGGWRAWLEWQQAKDEALLLGVPRWLHIGSGWGRWLPGGAPSWWFRR